MFKKLMILFGGIVLIASTGCSIETPEVRGIVLDQETKQPVPEAWIRSILQVETKTIQGRVTNYLSVDPPHTKSNPKGEFVIPAKKFKRPPFPHWFNSRVEKFSVNVETLDDKVADSEISVRWWQKNVNVSVHVKPWEKFLNENRHSYPYLYSLYEYNSAEIRTEGLNLQRAYSFYLSSLHKYCFSGRVAVELPPVKRGCDEWELNYAIMKHEKFIKKLSELKTMEQRNIYAGSMKRLAYLYKKKGDFKKAIGLFKTVRDFDKRRKMDLWIREYENQINEIKQLVKDEQE